jgi:hypothetical protein
VITRILDDDASNSIRAAVKSDHPSIGTALRRSGLLMVNQRTSPTSSVINQSTDKTVDTPEPGYRSTMGFNPFREQNTTPFDIFMVVLAIGGAIALVLWAIFSG